MADASTGPLKFHHKELVRRFLEIFNRAQPHHYTVTRWPDEEERSVRACDAFAEAPDAQALAIEHTIIEIFDGRKLDDARFLKVLAPLEAELRNVFPYWVELLVPTFAVAPGGDWDVVRSSIREWLKHNVPSIQEGRTEHQVPSVPFRITVDKHRDMRGGFLVARLTPPGWDDGKQLVEKFRAAMVDKNEQLGKYRDSGAETILLAESDDVALASLQTLYRAFLLAWDTASTANIRQVWMVHSYAPEDWCGIVCFLGPEEVMDDVNPANFCYGPRYRDMWFSAMRREKFAGLS